MIGIDVTDFVSDHIFASTEFQSTFESQQVVKCSKKVQSEVIMENLINYKTKTVRNKKIMIK